jgi:hypothetical protein
MDIFSGDNLMNLIKAVGLIGVIAIVFAESGLLIGFFLPIVISCLITPKM